MALEKQSATKDDFLALPLEGATIAEKLIERTGTIGEKIEVSDYHLVEGENIASYIHAGSKIGVVVVFKDGGKDGADQFFRSVAMHIAAMNPKIMRPDEFEADFVAKETEAIQAQIKAENELNESENLGKPQKKVPQFTSKLQLTDEVMAQVEKDIRG